MREPNAAVAIVVPATRFTGPGLGAAIAINLSGGGVLAGWLAFGSLALPLRGRLLLWGRVALALVPSRSERLAGRSSRPHPPTS